MATRYANNNNSQPLPSPPITASPTSPKRNRGISFGGKSEKSHRSNGSTGGKISLHETPEEKARRNLHTKADPTLAMNEAQPAMVAVLEKSNLMSLRSLQHKDQYGNIITDPDLSNPTRPRLERPLDTIRSFEAAIDGSYHTRRMSYATDASQSRPTSYYGGNNDYNQAYGRPSVSRPGSYIDHGASGSNGYSYQGQGQRRPRQANNRMNSEYSNGNGYNQQQQFYPNAAYQQSNDNFTAGSGSANTDQWGNSTDPSSVNSSYDRLQQQAAQQKHYQQQQQQSESYGFNGFGGNPDTSFQQQEYRNGPPPPPVHGQSYGQTNGAMSSQPFNPPLPAPARNMVEEDKKAKRGSWFKRRFSKD